MKKGAIKWSAAVPIRRPDNIISSKSRENGDMGFVPDYEKVEPRENMSFIMSNEYMRLWFKQLALYEIDTYSKLDVEAGANEIRRRFVQRYAQPPRKVKPMPIITLKMFKNKNITGKSDHKRPPKNKESPK